MNILILILVEVIVAQAIGLWLMNSAIKRIRTELNQSESKFIGFKKIVKEELLPKKKPVQEEFEVDEDTYNQTIEEWIYGAEEKEGGIDG